MYANRQSARINVKALIILAVVAVVLLGGGAAAYKIRKGVVADRALEAGRAALKRGEWARACNQLHQYLVRYPDTRPDVLLQYADACLRSRPPRLGAAKGAYRRYLRHHPADDHACEQLVRLYMHERDFTEAEYIASERLADDESDLDATLALARARIELSDLDGARPLLEKVKDDASGPMRIQAYGRLAELERPDPTMSREEHARRLKKMKQYLDECVNENGDSPRARVQRGQFLRKRADGEYGDVVKAERDRLRRAARDDFEAADRLAPTEPGTRLALAGEWMRFGEWNRAEAELDALDATTDEILASAYVDPADCTLLRYFARIQLATRRGDTAQAAEIADRALEEFAGKAPAQRQRRFLFLRPAAEAYVAGIQLATRRNDTALAARLSDKAKGTIGEFDDVVAGLPAINPELEARSDVLNAALATAEGQPYDVISRLKDLVVRRPDTTPAWRLLATAYDRTNQPRLAIDALENYVRLSPEDTQGLLDLARAHGGRGDWTAAVRFARRAEATDVSSADARLLMIEGTLNGGAGSLSDEDITDLLSELDRLEEDHPDTARIDLLRASVLVALKRDDAIDLLKRAMGNSDEGLTAAIRLVGLLSFRGDTQEALDVCRRAVSMKPDMAAPRLLLAQLQAQANLPKEARKTLKQAIENLAGDEQITAMVALARFDVADEKPAAAVELYARVLETPQDANHIGARVAVLGLQPIQDDVARAQRVVDEIKNIEGEKGLRWRYEQAGLWLRQDDWSDKEAAVLELLSYCVKADPGAEPPAVLLGLVYGQLSQPDKAEEVYRRSLDANDAAVNVAGRLLTLLTGQGRFVEADAILKRVRDPRGVLSSHFVGVDIGRGRHDDAREKLEKVVAADSKNVASRILLARLVHETKWERAVELLDEAAEHSDDRFTICGLKAEILRLHARGDEALQFLNDEVDRHDDYVAYLLRAQFQVAMGAFDEAEKDFRRLTGFEEEAVAGYHVLGMFLTGRGRTDEAIAAWQEGLEHDEDNAALRAALARVLLASDGEPSKKRGREILEKLLDEHPDNHLLLMLRAAGRLVQNTPAALGDAETDLTEIVRIESRYVPAHVELIKLAIREQDPEKATQRVVRALDVSPDNPDLLVLKADLLRAESPAVARLMLENVLRENESHLAARLTLIDLFLAERDLDAAETHLLEVDALAPGVRPFVERRLRLALARKDFDLLDKVLSDHRQAHPTDLDLLIMGARMLTTSSDPRHLERAAAILDEVDTAAPGARPVVVARLGLALAREDFDLLDKTLSDHRQAHPTDLILLIMGAEMLTTSSDPRHLERAAAILDGVIAEDDSLVPAYIARARLAYLSKNLDGCEKAYRQALDIEPDNPRSANDLAWILAVDKNDPASALEFANRGLAGHPDDKHLLDTRGVVFYLLDRLEEAEADLKKCVEIIGSDADPATQRTLAQALFHLARVNERQGKMSEVKAHLEGAMEIDKRLDVFSGDTDRADIRRMLEAAAGDG